MTKDDLLLAAAVNAAASLEAIYEWFDRVEKAGGATSIEGVAACHAFLNSLRKNRPALKEKVMKPLAAAIQQREEQKA